MKSWLKKNMFAICSSCLAYSITVYYGSRCLFLLGEPEFPVEE